VLALGFDRIGLDDVTKSTSILQEGETTDQENDKDEVHEIVYIRLRFSCHFIKYFSIIYSNSRSLQYPTQVTLLTTSFTSFSSTNHPPFTR